MERLIILLLFSIFPAQTFGQQVKQKIDFDGVSQLSLIDTVEDAKELAKKDIGNNDVFLLLQGGFAPIIYTSDKSFEKKYFVRLRDFGCVSPNKKLIVAYNTETFNYLTKKFGKNWIKECRPDIIGLKEYKRNLK